jgi:glyoxylase-like metal-dependent hydrolase (beta-lactamase superfamily II)
MHEHAPSRRVQLRAAGKTHLASRAGAVQIVPSPGHTQDSICVLWGPFLFTGDTVLYADTGRDDLPGGSAEDHYEGIQSVKALAQPESIFLPGHDSKGGRVSSWETQLKVNTSLTQSREDFVREASAFDVAAPKLLKASLRENFK